MAELAWSGWPGRLAEGVQQPADSKRGPMATNERDTAATIFSARERRSRVSG